MRKIKKFTSAFGAAAAAAAVVYTFCPLPSASAAKFRAATELTLSQPGNSDAVLKWDMEFNGATWDQVRNHGDKPSLLTSATLSISYIFQIIYFWILGTPQIFGRWTTMDE